MQNDAVSIDMWTPEINVSILGNTVTLVGVASLEIIVTIFVLTVAFLGKAAKLSKEKKADAEIKSKQDFDTEIAKLQKELGKNDANLSEIKQKISDLQTKKAYNENKINEIEKKYNRLGLKEAVLQPGSWILLSLVFENWVIESTNFKSLQIASFILGVVFLAKGVSKIIATLRVVEETSLETDDSQVKQIQEALVAALKAVDDQKKPKPSIKFTEKAPFIFKTGTENKIEFEIALKETGSPEARNVDAWFLFSPEIELVKNTNSGEPFKQSANYPIANANTLRYKFDLVKKHTKTSGVIKIKANIPGTFVMRYKVDCDNYVESAGTDREIAIIVKD